MTQEINTQTDRPDNAVDQDLIGELLRSAGKRSSPPSEIYQQVWVDANEALSLKLKSRRKRRNTISGVAAGLAAMTLGWMMFQPPAREQSAAYVVEFTGTVSVTDNPQQWQALSDGRSGIEPGTMISNDAESSAVLLMGGGVEIRMDADSQLTVVDSRNITLHEGRIHLDTGTESEARSDQIIVTTEHGVVRDIGTRFEVQYRDSDLRLRIRDGQVELARGEQREVVPQGQQLMIDSVGTTQRSAFSAWDPYWGWTHSMATAPELDGRPVRVLLEWVARETGRKLVYRDQESAAQANTTRLNDNVPPLLMPMEALVVLETTDFGYSVRTDGVLELWINRDLTD